MPRYPTTPPNEAICEVTCYIGAQTRVLGDTTIRVGSAIGDDQCSGRKGYEEAKLPPDAPLCRPVATLGGSSTLEVGAWKLEDGRLEASSVSFLPPFGVVGGSASANYATGSRRVCPYGFHPGPGPGVRNGPVGCTVALIMIVIKSKSRLEKESPYELSTG